MLVGKGEEIECKIVPIVSNSQQPWDSFSTKFVLGLPHKLRGNGSIFIIVDKISKMVYCMSWTRTINATIVVNLLFKQLVRLHGLLKSIVSDMDMRFMGHFWGNLWMKLV